jgi:ribosome biogenesis GTPase
VRNALSELGWSDALDRSMRKSIKFNDEQLLGRIRRIDRGLSTFHCVHVGRMSEQQSFEEHRVRNLRSDVAVGDWIVVTADCERIVGIVPPYSCLVRRAASDDDRATAQRIAANLDVVFLVHALDAPPNQRRLERELVLAFDSGARPVVVLTKSDGIDTVEAAAMRDTMAAISLGVAVCVVSSVTGEGIDELRRFVSDGVTAAVLGASGVGKSTLVNALTGTSSQETGAVRRVDQRGRHTTAAVELIPLPEHGWLIDTPGLRAVGLWTSGHGIERAFADIFALAEHCRFRDCKHEHEPGCAVLAAIADGTVDGTLDRARLESMRRLVAEEAALERTQQRARRR